MKKILLFSIIVFSSLFLTGCAKKDESQNLGGAPTVKPTPFPTKPVEQTIKERPYVSLLPSSDGHWLTLELKNIVKGTKSLEYDLIYMADVEGNRLERGVSTGGVPIDLSGQTEYSKKNLLGSASCTTGVCKYKYDENVTEGTLSMTLTSPNGKDKYDSVYRIQKGSEAKEAFTTGDGIFSLTTNNLPAKNAYLVISSIGIPVPLPEGVSPKTVPYAVYPALSGKGTVSFKTSSIGNVYALVEKSWQKLATKVESGKATADFSNSSLFILGQ